MRVVVSALYVQKAGNAPDEYEDAFAPAEPVDANTRTFRLAVSDGATEASFSGLWATILARAYAEGRLQNGQLSEQLVDLQHQWRREIGERRMPWYAEEKLKTGAFATLAGLTLQAPEGQTAGTWSVLAIGDSCVMHLRGSELLRSFPLDRAEQFGNTPALVSSNSSHNAELLKAFQSIEGTWEYGDVFYLMTDALASYFLRRWQVIPKNDCVDDFLSLFSRPYSASEFEKFISSERPSTTPDGEILMRNDDVTLLRCQVVDV